MDNLHRPKKRCLHIQNTSNTHDIPINIIWSPKDRESICDPPGQISIELYTIVEKNRFAYKKRICKFLARLEKDILLDNQPIIDSLGIDGHLTLWWCTELAEKDLYLKESALIDIIKLFALKDILEKTEEAAIIHEIPGDIYPILASEFQSRCTGSNRIEENNNSFILDSKQSFHRGWTRLAKHIIRISIVKLVGCRLNTKAKRPISSSVFINYLLRNNPLANETYSSQYWDTVPEEIKEIGIHPTWIHQYVRSDECKNIFQALMTVARLNTSTTQESHFLLEEFASIRTLVKTIRSFAKYKLAISKNMLLTYKGSDLRPSSVQLLLNRCCKDLQDTAYVLNQISTHSLLENLVEKLDSDSFIVYPAESKLWEKSLCCLSRTKCIHTVGYVHTTIRHWDLRYTYEATTNRGIGSLPAEIFVTDNYYQDKIVFGRQGQIVVTKVEATRYTHLLSLQNEDINSNSSNMANMLIIGDISSESLNELTSIALGAIKEYSVNWRLRKHPVSTLDESRFEVSINYDHAKTIKESLKWSTFIVTTQLTSASLDALYAGKSLFVMQHSSGLNLTPIPDEHFEEFSESGELRELLSMKSDFHKNHIKPDLLVIEASKMLWVNRIKELMKL